MNLSSISNFFISFPSLFKEDVFDIRRISDWAYLNSPQTVQFKLALPIIIILGLVATLGIVLKFIVEKRHDPRYYKRYLSRIGDFLFYIPFFLIFASFIRIAGVENINRRIFPVVLCVIWLIWFAYLIYYRLVYVAKMSLFQKELKRKEKYLNGGKN